MNVAARRLPPAVVDVVHAAQVAPQARHSPLLQPLFRDDTDDTTARYAPIRMPTMRMSPADLNALIANPHAAATTLQRLRDRKEDES